ncbi:type III-A CRISPR-associated RAMP protein Csm3 [Caloramator sp. CAR-1]|uniref:type III-A CRISPR-associated RAMP protein Csm3 n=1 Tax=Caloramator sp. CAR-1 TaxID=3062777 RepID=UPI0026E304A7|nr:type III-A CRISPR-associated RAMP protein Csm3 [Caloramator sp. CAR-1]MDO6354574.1 type III-A CRISPR-associated RAMP protein Csm3 [Caloramator sp. CAR-1]
MSFKEVTFKGKYIVNFDIELKTGLHIGTAGNTLDIGGVDNPVIKDAFGRPYIPGSSLKGKLRSLMEFYHDKININNLVYSVKKEQRRDSIVMHMCGEEDCPVCNLFGRNHGEHDVIVNDEGNSRKVDFSEVVMPTRLIVRDALLDEKSITDEMKENMDLEFTEVKFENNLDRITSAANPRQTERVPAGARFNASMVVNVYDEDGNKYVKELITALKLLQDDYLGGQGSRGYGQVAIKNIKISFRDIEYYKGQSKEEKLVANADSLDKINL